MTMMKKIGKTLSFPQTMINSITKVNKMTNTIQVRVLRKDEDGKDYIEVVEGQAKGPAIIPGINLSELEQDLLFDKNFIQNAQTPEECAANHERATTMVREYSLSEKLNADLDGMLPRYFNYTANGKLKVRR